MCKDFVGGNTCVKANREMAKNDWASHQFTMQV